MRVFRMSESDRDPFARLEADMSRRVVDPSSSEEGQVQLVDHALLAKPAMVTRQAVLPAWASSRGQLIDVSLFWLARCPVPPCSAAAVVVPAGWSVTGGGVPNHPSGGVVGA